VRLAWAAVPARAWVPLTGYVVGSVPLPGAIDTVVATGDGRKDVLTVLFDQGDVTTHPLNPDGTLGAQGTPAAVGPYPRAIAYAPRNRVAASNDIAAFHSR
jgi:hypothetical protein